MQKDAIVTVQELKNLVETFVKERDWQQFHSPKNLAMALAIEAAELMEPFRFATEKESEQIMEEKREEIAFELADILIAALDFCALNNIDLSDSIMKKLVLNAKKYPIEKAKGNNKKYTYYQT